MGGIFGVVSKKDCTMDLFFGIDYHSHLGTRRGGMAVYSEKDGFSRSIHNIENSPFRTKFERDVAEMPGNMGIGCISDMDPQPLIVRTHFGTYAITTVGRINNAEELANECFDSGKSHFLEMSGGNLNATELTAALINQKESITQGIKYAQERIDGSMSILILTPTGIFAARDRLGRTPVFIGQKEDGFCASLESSAYLNLGYSKYKELGPGEIVFIKPNEVIVKQEAGKKKKICAFLWTYYGYPTSEYEGKNVEQMRYDCGRLLAKADAMNAEDLDYVAGVPDSGTAHAIGYANQSGAPFGRPFMKYTPTWARSFMPQNQAMRNLTARMKLIPVDALIRGKRLLFIDDSMVRGTQLRETVDFLYDSGAEEVHIRLACPPILFGCKYLNFSRSTSDLDLIARRVIAKMEGTESIDVLAPYTDYRTDKYAKMVDTICAEMGFTSLRFQTLEEMIESIGIDPEEICTYCWNGKQ